MRTFAEEMKAEQEALRRRFVHATRPKGPMSLAEAQELCLRMEGGSLPNPSPEFARVVADV